MYQIGEVIKRTRESLGMTQEALSSGICSVETLSRIENGKHVPNRAHFQALMERMGKRGERYLPFLRSDDMDVLDEWEKIERKYIQRKFEEVDTLLNAFESRVDMEDPVNRQLVIRLRTLNNYYRGKIDEKEKREGLLQALRCTIPNFNESQISSSVFSRYEVRLLCNIAVSYAEEGNLDRAIVLLRNLEQYFLHTSIDKEERYIEETLLLSNLAQILGQNGNILEALEMNEKGISMCLETGEGERLATFLYNAGFEMELLERNETDCKEKMIQAYYIAELYENKKRMRHIAKHWKERYGSDICV